jgi:hypothetical protein
MLRALIAIAVLSSCSGLREGEACDPTLNSRDCEQGLSCTYSFDDCPQWGCPKCRRPCRSHADCTGAPGCEAACVQQGKLEDRGMCQVCEGYRPWWPP